MSEAAKEAEPEKAGGGKMMILLSLVLALVGAGGGFFAASAGLIPVGGKAEKEDVAEAAPSKPATVFLPVDPIVVSLGAAAANRHLSFRAQLEVSDKHAAEVQAVMPRLVDVLNSYLRAVDVREFDAPAGLIRLRAQMLRRIQLVAGDGRVNDLLVMEFVLN